VGFPLCDNEERESEVKRVKRHYVERRRGSFGDSPHSEGTVPTSGRVKKDHQRFPLELKTLGRRKKKTVKKKHGGNYTPRTQRKRRGVEDNRDQRTREIRLQQPPRN